MLAAGQDMELLAAVRAVAVPDEADGLEDVERPVHGRRGRRRVDGPAALDELSAGHVAVGPGQDVDERAPLGCPAEPAAAQQVVGLGPGCRERPWRHRLVRVATDPAGSPGRIAVERGRCCNVLHLRRRALP